MLVFQDADIYRRVSVEICECLYNKSKWTMCSWSWVSLSNLRIYYDTKVIRSEGHFLPIKLDLQKFLDSLVKLGLVEKNPEMFLNDGFYKLTKLGRELLSIGPEEITKFLSA